MIFAYLLLLSLLPLCYSQFCATNMAQYSISAN
jgi:hypothetical protein